MCSDWKLPGLWRRSASTTTGDIWWDPTIQGNALAMASFGKPISRKTAERLVSGLLERAQTYNADPDKPMFVNTLRVFGSDLSPEIDPIGDVDIELTYGRRITRPKRRCRTTQGPTYSIDADPQAVPAPADRSLIGR